MQVIEYKKNRFLLISAKKWLEKSFSYAVQVNPWLDIAI